MNHVILTGRLVKDPETRYTKDNKAHTTFTLAVDDGKRDGVKMSQYIPCSAWGQTAELIDKYFLKGYPLTVIGKITVRNYEKDGRKVYVTEVSVSGIEFPLSKPSQKTGDGEVAGVRPFAEIADEDGELPF